MTRTAFATTSRGLDHRSYPMTLWRKAKQLGTWDPAAFDFTQDRADWLALTDAERDLLLRLTAQFQGGEESVTMDLLPLLGLAAREGRIEEEMFLTAYLWEEAKHVEGFGRFLAEVAEAEGDLSGYFTDAYRTLFMERLPEAMQRVNSPDASPVTVAEAVATYQMIVEGTLAETGYEAYYRMLDERDVMPGMREMVRHVQRDEARHVAYGVYLLARLVAEHGDAVWQAIQTRMQGLLMLVMQHIQATLSPYGADVPFGLSVGDFTAIGLAQFQKRLARLEKARTQTPEEVRYGHLADAASATEPRGDGEPGTTRAVLPE
jgi:ribonucleoside-diphosphate reductase beta chain